MKTDRRIFIGLAASASLFSSMSTALAETVLNVGAYPTNPPFETKTSSGTFEGFEVDIVDEAAKPLFGPRAHPQAVTQETGMGK